MLLNKCLTVILASFVIGTVSVSGGEVASKNAENKLIITDKICILLFYI